MFAKEKEISCSNLELGKGGFQRDSKVFECLAVSGESIWMKSYAKYCFK